MREFKLLTFVIIPVLILSGCSQLFEPEHFGVQESVWNTLSEESKQKAIDGYNEREQRRQAQEAEKARKEQELKAQNAPYEFALRIAETISGNESTLKIKERFGSSITLSNNASYRVENSSAIRNWKEGDSITVYESDDFFYGYVIVNLKRVEEVKAKVW